MRRVLLFLAVSLTFFSVAISATPRVITSIAPIHSIAYAVMKDVAAPQLLIPAGQSAHHLSLAPSDAKRLHDADFIIWVGPSLESFLSRPLENLSRTPVILALEHLSALTTYPQRQTIEWEAHDHAHGHSHDIEAFPAVDPHLWLSSDNAKIIAFAIRDHLMLLDPDNSLTYHANTLAFAQQCDVMAAAIEEQLAPIQNVPYLVFHDAYQYFEQRYALSGVGAMHLHPGAGLSVRRVHQIRDIIQGRGAKCVFREPQFPSEMVTNILDGLSTRQGLLDPLGADIPAGPDGYFHLLHNLADHLLECLGEP
jgi:zinc transport system substrate-binding protein